MFERKNPRLAPKPGYSLALLAMLATALLASARTGLVDGFSSPESPRRTILVQPADVSSHHLNASHAQDPVPASETVAFEDEKPGSEVALDEPRVSFVHSWSYRGVFLHDSIVRSSLASPFHLRC